MTTKFKVMREDKAPEAPFIDERQWSARFCLALVAVLTILFLLPAINKAFHIDDPLFIWAAQHIQHHPLDPYRFSVNWYGSDMPMWEVTKNPPLACYYIALVARLVGWSERALHVAGMLPALAVILGTYILGRRLSGHPVLASLICLVTPVFLLSSTTVMCDVMMLAFWVWAVALWIYGLDRTDHRMLGGSMILVVCAALTKYFGIALIPLLCLYGFMKMRKRPELLAYLIIPLIILAWYQWATHAAYGRGLLSDASAFATSIQSQLNFGFFTKGCIGLAFTGGCLLAIAFLIPFAWPRKTLLALPVVVLAALAIVAIINHIGLFVFRGTLGVRWAQLIQFALFIALGVHVCALAIMQWWSKRMDAETILLAVWTIGTFIFAGFINWSVNGRSILPMVPAVSILMVRQIEERGLPEKLQPALFACLIPAMLISLVVMRADYLLANNARTAAQMLCAKYVDGKRTVWFEGHWGFQYYMQQRGARSMTRTKTTVLPSDRVIIPENNCFTFPLPIDTVVTLDETVTIGAPSGCATMSRFSGAGFYLDQWGPLPFVFAQTPPERYAVLTLRTADAAAPMPEPAVRATEALRAQPNNPQHYAQRATAYIDAKQDMLAASDLTQLTIFYPYDDSVYFMRANAYLAAGDYSRAIADYSRALEFRPQAAIIYFKRAQAYRLNKDRNSAVLDLNKTLSLDPRFADAYKTRADIYYEVKYYDNAAMDYSYAAFINPSDAAPYRGRGNIYVIRGLYDKAIADFDQAIKINKDDAEAYHNRAVAYFKKGDLVKASDDVKKAQELGYAVNPLFREQLAAAPAAQRESSAAPAVNAATSAAAPAPTEPVPSAGE